MDSTGLVLLSLAVGVIIGATAVFFVVWAGRVSDRVAEVTSPSLPDGVEQVLMGLDIAAVVVDRAGTVQRCSDAAIAFGLVEGDRLVHEELVDIVIQARRSDRPVADDIQLERGRFGESELHLKVRAGQLGARYIMLLAEDRTESHRLDTMRRDFVANVSHELKTPIGAVSLLGEAIEQSADEPDKVRHFAGKLTREADRLNSITRELIQLSRLQASEPVSTLKVYPAGEIIAATVNQNQIAAEAKSITLVVGGDLGAEVHAKRAQLVTALDNLVSNAINYSPEGSRVGIGVRDGDGIVEISVTDQGLGISMQDQERVFERFYRVDEARSRATGGTGLGLSIAKHAVENQGGQIGLWSKLGRGSTFTVRLPKSPATSDRQA